jgi:hypothetical protein
MHYEGADHYSDDIECTDWRQYDIEVRHPDVVFTFAPYDSGNYVTSVPPDFYCERLQKLTDLLVYVPYFVVVGKVPDHFCTVAGCMFAHKVVLQSEKIRDTYVRVFGETYGNRFGKPEDKFVALGSPKYDKTANTRREDCPLPDEWHELIGGRKIILYNTNVGAILQGNEQYLKKLRHVLDTFLDRTDVVLWWRPHPLNEATYHSMRPQLLDDYEQIIAGYRRGAWGIYDDTPDLHRAIAWSDAYYGDWSSLVPMYQITGKPEMVANASVTRNAVKFLPTSIYFSGDCFWISVRCINALFKMNENSWNLEFVGSFPGEAGFTARFNSSLFQAPAESNGVIYFPPYLAKEIATYSVVDDAFTKIAYQKPGDEETCRRDFLGTVAHGDYVYFTPYLHPAIARLNPATNEIDYYSDWVEPLKRRMGDVQDAFFLSPITVNRTIWLAACGANAVVEFDVETCKSKVHEVGKNGYRYSGICFDGENYWLSPRHRTNTPVIKWNPETGVIKEYAEIYADDEEPYGFLSMVYCGGVVWLLPLLSRHAYKIDVCSGRLSIAEEFEPTLSDDRVSWKNRKYCLAKTFGDSVFAYNELSGTLVEYDCATKARREEVVRFSRETMAQIEPLLESAFLVEPEQMKSNHDCYYRENEIVGLSDFLNYLASESSGVGHSKELRDKRREIAQGTNVHADGTAGQAIYDFAKKTLFE